jgi:hypothetical protein
MRALVSVVAGLMLTAGAAHANDSHHDSTPASAATARAKPDEDYTFLFAPYLRDHEKS